MMHTNGSLETPFTTNKEGGSIPFGAHGQGYFFAVNVRLFAYFSYVFIGEGRSGARCQKP